MKSRTIANSRSSRSERPDLLGLSTESSHWMVMKSLLPFIWPAGRPDLRAEVAGAFVVLVLAKLVTVAVPVAFKWATDWLAADLANPGVAAAKHLAFGIAMLIVAYGVGRVLMMVLNQVRDVLFTRVGQHAIRELNNRTFRHL
ncbi:MAG TPA: metal ABC transporter permease, partial [Hyphomicrobium sp.]|nr:metal ABC transporter permease [Hyphomicrobium sp.]